MSIAGEWALLGIAPTDDKKEVKRAYARKLKTIDVDADPAAFVRLREALDAAVEWGTATPWWELDVDVDHEDGNEPDQLTTIGSPPEGQVAAATAPAAELEQDQDDPEGLT